MDVGEDDALDAFARSWREEHERAESALLHLYRYMWGFCAGWNRVSFRGPQFRYIKKRYPALRIRLAPIGRANGMVVLIGADRFINLNTRLFARRDCDDSDEQMVLSLLGRPNEGFARFVFLHELGHLLLHQDRPGVWTIATSRNGKNSSRLHLSRAPFASPLDERVASVMREVEADFYALVAMIPDFVLMQALQERSAADVMDMVVEQIGGHLLSDEQVAGEVRLLAEYRIKLFERFSYVLRDVSTKAFASEAQERYRNPVTIERVLPYRADHKADLQEIALAHPLVAKNQELSLAIKQSGAVPFAHVSTGAPSLATSRPLTHRLDLSRIVCTDSATHHPET